MLFEKLFGHEVLSLVRGYYCYCIGDPKPLLNIEKRKSVDEAPSSAGGVEIQMKDIASGRAALRRVTSADKNKV